MSRHGNRSRSSMAYYALGYAKNVQPSRFKSHIAEPVFFNSGPSGKHSAEESSHNEGM